ncbi:MAG: class I SAM-dependent methyltransferase [Methanolinea sp.]|jgi:SAM-dependent methyltransferase|nr:class I SAM-dependent methyltransferase [Methanolinea sp.]
MNALEVLYRVHAGLPRQGPGSVECTTYAYKSITLHSSAPVIMDIGCGSGASALVLSRLSKGTVAAVDNHLPFLRELRERAWALHGPARGGVQPVQASMASLPVREESVDLIWSEGSAYIMGFAHALGSLQPLLKPGGFLALTEVTWLVDDPPAEICSYWKENYPGIVTDARHRETIAGSGFLLRHSFTLPESAWWNYYHPLQGRMRRFRQEYAEDPVAQDVLDEIDREIAMYEKYHESYGYVMYIMEKQD